MVSVVVFVVAGALGFVAGLDAAEEGTMGLGGGVNVDPEAVCPSTVAGAATFFTIVAVPVLGVVGEVFTAFVPAFAGLAAPVVFDTAAVAGVAGLSGTWGKRWARISAARVGAGVEAGASRSSFFVITRTSSRWFSVAEGLTVS